MLVIAISCGDQRTRVADDHSGAPEALGEQIVVVAAQISPATAERPEPRRRPLTGRNFTALPTSLSEDYRNAIVRQLLDQPSQLVPLGAHRASLTETCPPGPEPIGASGAKSATRPLADQRHQRGRGWAYEARYSGQDSPGTAPRQPDGGLVDTAGKVMPVIPGPTLHLTVGLPGVGKTTLARQLEQTNGALRLTPDDWMAPLFGLRWDEFGEKRDVLEGRLIWVGHQVLQAGVSVILDFGCWSPEERYALRTIADLAGADFELHYLTLPEDERRQRADARWRESPEDVFQISVEDHEQFRALFTPPTPDELQGRTPPPPPRPFTSWPAWASDRWPTLPRLDT